jgi:cell division protein FtsA
VETKGEQVNTSYSDKRHASGDISSDGSFNISGITNTCRSALADLPRSSKKTVLGIGGGFVYGKTLTQTYIREQPHKEIEESELANIIQKVQQRNFEQIRRDFKRETGRSELEVHIIAGSVQDIKIDGYQVVSPIGFKGKEVTCSLFNSYIPKIYLGIFNDLISALNLELAGIISQPYAVFSKQLKQNTAEQDFILIDIGGSATEVSVVRKGKLDDIRSISVGGSSFTRSISENLKIGFWEAENIKLKFSGGHVSATVAKKIESILAQDVELFLHGLEIVLSDLSQVTLLPASIYMYGGGALLPQILTSLKQNSWRENLSFFSKPGVQALKFPDKTVPLSMVDAYLAQAKNENELARVLKRSLRLIQG